MNTNKEIFN